MQDFFGLIDLFIMTQTMKLREAAKAFKDEQRGASDMVAVMVLIVIVVAVATVFNQQLGEAVTAVFEKLTNFVSSTN